MAQLLSKAFGSPRKPKKGSADDLSVIDTNNSTALRQKVAEVQRQEAAVEAAIEAKDSFPVARKETNDKISTVVTPESASSAPRVGKGQAPAFLDGVIQVVNSLQDLFAKLPTAGQLPIELPQIAVVGGQSSGKSSVLEGLVGRDFLPRNKDICTRRPLVLQLVREPAGTAEYAEFLHKPGEIFTHLPRLRDEIEAETDREVGSKFGVSNKPIFLKVHSPDVLTMTLVDLPGITKIPVGDQPANIEELITNMTMEYISKEACIILAVSAGNSDISNSDALKLAQEADPEGKRTLGVITKLDIMDDGTDARDVLLGNAEPKLRLGYVGVINRSQRDIQANKSVQAALDGEQAWFNNSAKAQAYRDIAAEYCGNRVLARKLNKLLGEHIWALMPKLRADIRTQLRRLQDDMTAAGHVDIADPAGQAAMVRRILARFDREFRNILEGDFTQAFPHLYGGSRIINQLKIFATYLQAETTRLCARYSDEELQHYIRNVSGMDGLDGATIIAERAFRTLVPAVIKALERPCQAAACLVFEEMVLLIDSALAKVDLLDHYPVLSTKIKSVAEQCLRAALAPGQEMITKIIAMEAGFINTSHPNFIGGTKAAREAAGMVLPGTQFSITDNPTMDGADDIASRGMRLPTGVDGQTLVAELVIGNLPSQKLSSNADFAAPDLEEEEVPQQAEVVRVEMSQADRLSVEMTRLCLHSYANVVCANLQDLVPKAILHFLVNQVKFEGMGESLRMGLDRPELYRSLLAESAELVEKHQHWGVRIDALNQALALLEDVPGTLHLYRPKPEDSVRRRGPRRMTEP